MTHYMLVLLPLLALGCGGDRYFARAMAEAAPARARAAWRAALDTLNAHAPTVFLYTPVQVAAVSRRVQGLQIDPYSWLSGLSAVSLKP